MFGEQSPNSEKNRGVRVRCTEDREGADFLLLHFTTIYLCCRGKRLLDRLAPLLISQIFRGTSPAGSLQGALCWWSCGPFIGDSERAWRDHL